MEYENEMSINISAKSQNEAFARVVVAAFVSPLDPTVDEITDIKTAVSEAVTNCIIHGYENKMGIINIECKIKNREIYIKIRDEGKGIDNIEQARTPLFTSKPEMERSGLGFTVMETFMDKLEVESNKNVGTTVVMIKKLSDA